MHNSRYGQYFLLDREVPLNVQEGFTIIKMGKTSRAFSIADSSCFLHAGFTFKDGLLIQALIDVNKKAQTCIIDALCSNRFYR